MIASLQGHIGALAPDQLVIVVGGVGYRVLIPRGSISGGEGDAVYLHTEMIVREDAMTLYGFPTIAERDLFNLLTTVTGVGPKLALSVVGTMSLDGLRNAVSSGQPEMLTRVPGIGKNLAEKIMFELKDKLRSADGLITASAFGDVNKDVMDALIGFGYSVVEAHAAVAAIPADMPQNFDERMRRALQYFV
ncbi:MAG: Holliday junction branch migration protein RuvA [Chloroflexota bacterium]|nr:Holliday junction branch migration protein RuvA [Chloroflexota bacterium]